MMNIDGKEVLLICHKFYDYELEIKKSIEKQGAKVTLIYDNIGSYHLYYRMYYRYFPKKYNKVIYNYMSNILKKSNCKFDLVFVIGGVLLDEDTIPLVKSYCNKNCKYIMYQWDSAKNNPNAQKIAKLFDAIYTFDVFDSKNLNWNYRPLFYIDSYIEKNCEKKLDICYLCTWHSKRAQILQILKEFAKKNKFSLFYNMKVPFVFFMKHKYINKNPEYNDVAFRDVSFKTLSLKESYKLYQKSKVVVDYTHPGQTGLTMRTIECLGNGCKLVTNNKLIKDADFYNANNILVYEDELNIPREFIDTPYEKVDNAVLEKYSIDSWLQDILA